MYTNVVNAGVCGMAAEHGSSGSGKPQKLGLKEQTSSKPRKSCLSRQNSSKSLKSTTSSSMLQKKIQEHCFHQNTEEWNKQQTYNERRTKKKLIKKQVDSKKQLKCIRLLYFPAALGLTLGVVMIFGATIRTLSDGTVFWTHREHFYIIGPVVLVVGILFLLTGTGLENHFTSKLKKSGLLKIQTHIHPDFQREAFYRSLSDVTSGTYPKHGGERERLMGARNASTDFSLSSYSSDNGSFDVQAQWRRAMAIRLDDESMRKSSTSGDSVDSIALRTLVSTPEIMVTEAEDVCGLSENCVVEDTEKTDSMEDGKDCKVKIPLHDISEESLVEV